MPISTWPERSARSLASDQVFLTAIPSDNEQIGLGLAGREIASAL